MRILVVEDEQTVALAVLDALTDEGHTAAHAVGTDEALAIASGSGPFDLALVDARLAFGDSGIIACQVLLERHTIPSLLTTGWADIPDHVGSFALGVLHKPFSHDELTAAVRSVSALLTGGDPGVLPSRLDLFSNRLKPAV